MAMEKMEVNELNNMGDTTLYLKSHLLFKGGKLLILKDLNADIL
jgi:hypothetical protein